VQTASVAQFLPRERCGSFLTASYAGWHFLLANEKLLRPNPRLAMPYRTLARMTDERRQQITTEAQAFLTGLSHH
jgi:deoxyribodipyrimidine photolyase-like uncharacterized protein